MPPTGRHPSARPTASEAWPSPDEPYAAACPDNAGDTAAWRVRTRRQPGRHAVRRRAGAHRTPPDPPSTHESSTTEGRAPFDVSTMAGNPCHPGRLSDVVRQGMRLSSGLLGRRASPSAPLPLWCEVGFPSARPHARVGEPLGFLSGRVSGFALVEHHRTGFIPLAEPHWATRLVTCRHPVSGRGLASCPVWAMASMRWGWRIASNASNPSSS